MRNQFSSYLIPNEVQRLSAVLHYNDYCSAVLGEGPLQHMRLQLSGVMRISARARVLTLFVLRELREAGHPLHWRDVQRAWARHERWLGRRPCGDDAFWSHLV